MIEALLIGFFAWSVCWFVWHASAAWSLREISYRPPAELKWAINWRVMAWLLPIVCLGISAYIAYLKYLELI